MLKFYQPASGLTFTEANLRSQTGFSPTTPPSVLAANGIYTIASVPDPYDPALYTSVPAYAIVGFYAEQSWVATPRPLPEAKENGSTEVKEQADAATASILEANHLTSSVLASVASQAEVDRPAQLQTVLDETVAVSNALGANLDAIASATSVDEINNIVNKPAGTLFTGRGSGLGPQDLNESYYTAFNSVSMTESETELFVPGTSTVISYGSGGPGQFDSMGNCFAVGDYLLQIRETATGMVIAEFECPLNPAGEDVAF
jgi:hypothetical protein